MLALSLICDGYVLKNEFIASLAGQTVKVDLLVISRSEKSGEGRNWLRENALKLATSDPYFLLLNSDVIFGSNKDVEDLVNFLNTNTDYGAIAYDTRNRNDEAKVHVDIACMLVRADVLSRIVFRCEYMRCTCDAFKKDILALGYKIGYMEGKQLKELYSDMPSRPNSNKSYHF